jgi:mRNA interferase MazF
VETSDPEIHRGDVFWLAPDDTAEAVESYPHPHVVVQEDVFNHARITTVNVCALTSNLNRAHERIGRLSSERVDQIVSGLRFQQGSFFGR